MTRNEEMKSDEEILKFISDFCEFSDEKAYIISSMARPKENDEINHGEIPMFREIFTDEESLRRKFAKIKTLGENYISEEGNTLTFRIYFTPNARDSMSAFFHYQERINNLMENIYQGHEESKSKIQRMDKIWKSTLEKDTNKDDTNFLIDFDKKDREILKETKKELSEMTDIIMCMPTPNGYHILTKPFDPNEFNDTDLTEYCDLKKDGLMFLTYC